MRKAKTILMSILLMAAGYGVWNAWPTIQDTFTAVPQQTTLDMTWHSWKKDNITLLTQDHNQGLKILQHFDAIGKKWRPKDSPDMPITLVVVNDRDVMKQFFGHEQSKSEVRNGQIYIWFLWDTEGDLGL